MLTGIAIYGAYCLGMIGFIYKGTAGQTCDTESGVGYLGDEIDARTGF